MRTFCCYLSLVLTLGSVSEAAGAKHLVSATEFRTALIDQSDARAANLTEIQTLLDSQTADLGSVETALANLDDDTLQRLANQARQVNGDVSAQGKKTVAIVLVAAIVVGSVLLNLIPRD